MADWGDFSNFQNENLQFYRRVGVNFDDFRNF